MESPPIKVWESHSPKLVVGASKRARGAGEQGSRGAEGKEDRPQGAGHEPPPIREDSAHKGQDLYRK
ncbi:hypothetical protein FACHB389_08955 [Nostoc calcicola FACHB-389]|nr:hypothetical protein FACHB389_08955 [Nostoc calcicola FACHB-389]